MLFLLAFLNYYHAYILAEYLLVNIPKISKTQLSIINLPISLFKAHVFCYKYLFRETSELYFY